MPNPTFSVATAVVCPHGRFQLDTVMTRQRARTVRASSATRTSSVRTAEVAFVPWVPAAPAHSISNAPSERAVLGYEPRPPSQREVRRRGRTGRRR